MEGDMNVSCVRSMKMARHVGNTTVQHQESQSLSRWHGPEPCIGSRFSVAKYNRKCRSEATHELRYSRLCWSLITEGQDITK